MASNLAGLVDPKTAAHDPGRVTGSMLTKKKKKPGDEQKWERKFHQELRLIEHAKRMRPLLEKEEQAPAAGGRAVKKPRGGGPPARSEAGMSSEQLPRGRGRGRFNNNRGARNNGNFSTRGNHSGGGGGASRGGGGGFAQRDGPNNNNNQYARGGAGWGDRGSHRGDREGRGSTAGNPASTFVNPFKPKPSVSQPDSPFAQPTPSLFNADSTTGPKPFLKPTGHGFFATQDSDEDGGGATEAEETDLNAESLASFEKRMNEKWIRLKASRENERTRAIQSGMIADPDKKTSLANAIKPVGHCEDMCPEYERAERIFQKTVDRCEKPPSRHGKETLPDERMMVKKFRRSAAGVDEQLPSDLRTPRALKQSTDYLIDQIVGGKEALASVHKFVWDRTRAIRNDISILQFTNPADVKIAVYCLEHIARFHILSLHQLSQVDADQEFNAHQEREQLNRTLLSLQQLYDDNRDRVQLPSEPEFRAYGIIFDSRTDLEDHIQSWPRPLLRDGRIQLAIKLQASKTNALDRHGPLQPRASFNIAQGNYGGFFRLVKTDAVSHLMACVAEIFFNEVREMALQTILNVYKKRGVPDRVWSLEGLMTALAFDNQEQTREFAEAHGVAFGIPTGLEFVNLAASKYTADTNTSRQQAFSDNIVEWKRQNRTLPEIVHGVKVSESVNYSRTAQEMGDEMQGAGAEDDDEEESLFVKQDEREPAPAPTLTPQPSNNPFLQATFTPQSSNNPLGLAISTNQPSNSLFVSATPTTQPSSNPFVPATFTSQPAINPFVPAVISTQLSNNPFGQPASSNQPSKKPFTQQPSPLNPGASPFQPSSGLATTGDQRWTPDKGVTFGTPSSTPYQLTNVLGAIGDQRWTPDKGLVFGTPTSTASQPSLGSFATPKFGASPAPLNQPSVPSILSADAAPPTAASPFGKKVSFGNVPEPSTSQESTNQANAATIAAQKEERAEQQRKREIRKSQPPPVFQFQPSNSTPFSNFPTNTQLTNPDPFKQAFTTKTSQPPISFFPQPVSSSSEPQVSDEAAASASRDPVSQLPHLKDYLPQMANKFLQPDAGQGSAFPPPASHQTQNNGISSSSTLLTSILKPTASVLNSIPSLLNGATSNGSNYTPPSVSHGPTSSVLSRGVSQPGTSSSGLNTFSWPNPPAPPTIPSFTPNGTPSGTQTPFKVPPKPTPTPQPASTPLSKATARYAPLPHEVNAKKQQDEALTQVVQTFFLQRNGILDQFVENASAPIIEDVMRELDEERALKKWKKLRAKYLARKYGVLWRKRAYVLFRRRTSAEHRKRMRELGLKTRLEKLEKRKASQNAENDIQEIHVHENGRHTPPHHMTYFHTSPPGGPSSEPSRKRKSVVSSKQVQMLKSVRGALQMDEPRRHKRSRTMENAPAREAWMDPDLEYEKMPNGNWIIKVHNPWRTNHKVNWTKTDYFACKALGIDPDTPMIPPSYKALEKKEKKRGRDDGEIVEDTSKFQKVSANERRRSGHQSIDNENENGISISYTPTTTSTPERKSWSIEDEPLIQESIRLRARMAEDQARMREERLAYEKFLNDEAIAKAARRKQPHPQTPNGHDSSTSTSRRPYVPSVNRTEQRIARTGAHGLAYKPVRWNKPSPTTKQLVQPSFADDSEYENNGNGIGTGINSNYLTGANSQGASAAPTPGTGAGGTSVEDAFCLSD